MDDLTALALEVAVLRREMEALSVKISMLERRFDVGPPPVYEVGEASHREFLDFLRNSGSI